MEFWVEKWETKTLAQVLKRLIGSERTRGERERERERREGRRKRRENVFAERRFANPYLHAAFIAVSFISFHS